MLASKPADCHGAMLLATCRVFAARSSAHSVAKRASMPPGKRKSGGTGAVGPAKQAKPAKQASSNNVEAADMKMPQVALFNKWLRAAQLRNPNHS